ncbi:hypothetical protein VZO05_15030 [Aggregatilineales bacterium SYSU G02658]
MPASPKQLEEETIRLYETPAVREDLDDADAEVLLTWAEGQIKRLAQEDGDFAQKNRFLRQLLARINTLVGQRPYVDAAGEQHYLEALMKVLPLNGYHDLTPEQVLACLPPDRADVRANLTALLDLLNRELPPRLTPPPTAAELPPPRTWLEAALRYHAPQSDASTTTGDPT